jgi:hypothetical protein
MVCILILAHEDCRIQVWTVLPTLLGASSHHSSMDYVEVGSGGLMLACFYRALGLYFFTFHQS